MTWLVISYLKAEALILTCCLYAWAVEAPEWPRAWVSK